MSSGTLSLSRDGHASAHYHAARLPGLYCSAVTDAGRPRAYVHDRLALLTPTAGETMVWCRGEVHLLRPGSVLMIEPGDVHRSLGYSPYRAVMVVMRPELVAALRARSDGTALGAIVARCPALCGQILALFEAVRTRRDAATQERNAARVIELLAPFWTQTTRRTEPALVVRARRALLDAPGTTLSLDELAVRLRCAPSYLCRVFAEHVGVGPHAYQVQHRVLEARRLLESGCTVAHAAAVTGFGDESHLRRHFRRRFATPPGRYHRELMHTAPERGRHVLRMPTAMAPSA